MDMKRIEEVLDAGGIAVVVNTDDRGATIEDIKKRSAGWRSVGNRQVATIDHWTPNGKVRITVEKIS